MDKFRGNMYSGFDLSKLNVKITQFEIWNKYRPSYVIMSNRTLKEIEKENCYLLYNISNHKYDDRIFGVDIAVNDRLDYGEFEVI